MQVPYAKGDEVVTPASQIADGVGDQGHDGLFIRILNQGLHQGLNPCQFPFRFAKGDKVAPGTDC